MTTQPTPHEIKSARIAADLTQKTIIALEALGVTRYQVSLDTGISQATLSRWLTGKQRPSKLMQKILTDYYKSVKKRGG
jgi:transcriptional regulator with XRE-family HTH domain